MASGQQKAQQNFEAFMLWQATLTDDDFKQITVRGQLNRQEVAKAIGCGKSALAQNPALKAALKTLEDSLREKGVLPPMTESAKEKQDSHAPKPYDNSANRKIQDSKNLTRLEAENLELKAKLKELESKLERYGELSETLFEMGFPR